MNSIKVKYLGERAYDVSDVIIEGENKQEIKSENAALEILQIIYKGVKTKD